MEHDWMDISPSYKTWASDNADDPTKEFLNELPTYKIQRCTMCLAERVVLADEEGMVPQRYGSGEAETALQYGIRL